MAKSILTPHTKSLYTVPYEKPTHPSSTTYLAKAHGYQTRTCLSTNLNLLNKKTMDLEREKQLRNEYSDQRIVSNEQLERLKKSLTINGFKEVSTPEDNSWKREAMEFYEIKKDAMTRQERRAYLRMVAKNNRRKH